MCSRQAAHVETFQLLSFVFTIPCVYSAIVLVWCGMVWYGVVCFGTAHEDCKIIARTARGLQEARVMVTNFSCQVHLGKFVKVEKQRRCCIRPAVFVVSVAYGGSQKSMHASMYPTAWRKDKMELQTSTASRRMRKLGVKPTPHTKSPHLQ